LEPRPVEKGGLKPSVQLAEEESGGKWRRWASKEGGREGRQKGIGDRGEKGSPGTPLEKRGVEEVRKKTFAGGAGGF